MPFQCQSKRYPNICQPLPARLTKAQGAPLPADAPEQMPILRPKAPTIDLRLRRGSPAPSPPGHTGRPLAMPFPVCFPTILMSWGADPTQQKEWGPQRCSARLCAQKGNNQYPPSPGHQEAAVPWVRGAYHTDGARGKGALPEREAQTGARS